MTTDRMQPATVIEARKKPRFRMRDEVRATFAGNPAIVLDLSAEGIALRHTTPIKVNSSGSIRIESEENTGGVSFRGRVRWSHIARGASAQGTLCYDSGIHIEEVTDAVGGLLGRLIRAHGEKDTDSMRRKQEAALQRTQARSTPLSAAASAQPARTITRDQVLLVREARRKLENAPAQAQEWYARARQALSERQASDGASAPPHRRDVVAIWGYLGCKIDFDVITAVLDAQNT